MPLIRIASSAVVFLAALVFSGQALAVAAPVQPIAAYSLVAPNGASPSGLVARAVVPLGAGCPRLEVVKSSGATQSIAMTPRSAPTSTGAAFTSVLACTADIPANAAQARIGTAEIPAAMPAQVKRMAIFGDSGCRLKGSAIQNCASSATWPLGSIATSIANDDPDLIVFTGDFFYREAACPDSLLAGCGGSPSPISGMPFKDTAYSWAADVFVPMSPMFSQAPIVVTRGNHEACDRGGNGYFLYFDPRKGSEGSCAPIVGADGTLSVPRNNLNPSYASDIKLDAKRSVRFVVVDSSYGWDCQVSDIGATQRARYEQAQALATGHTSWLLVHRPVVAWQPNSDCGPQGGWISADQTVASAGLLGSYQMMLSSHIHVAEAVNIPGLPGQLVIGNGGTLLEDVLGPIPTTGAGPTFPGVSYPAPTSSWMVSRFGYVLATPKAGKDWAMQMRDPSGQTFATCSLKSKIVNCVG